LEAHRLPWDDAELVLIVGTPLSHRNDALAARSMSDLQKESLGALVHELRNVLNIFTGHTGLLLGTSLTAEQETSVAQLVKYAEHTVALNESLALLPHFYEDAFETLDLAGALRQSAPLLKLLWRDTESLTIDIISDDLQANINKGKLVAELLEMTRALRRQASSAARLSITLAREDSEQSTDFLEVQSHRFLAAISLELTADSETMSQSTALASVDQLQTNASNRLEASTAHLRDFLTSCGGTLTTTLTDESLRMDLRVPDLSRSDSDDDDKTKTRTVLLIEDDTGVRDLVVIFLESIGMDVVTIQSEDDLKALPMTNYALIVSDVMLPGARSGPELVAMVRRRQPNLPCLFISGYKQGVLKDEDLESDLTDFLPKPFSKSAFLNKVRTFLPAENSAS
jgi:CheY-like chemotaxis protein